MKKTKVLHCDSESHITGLVRISLDKNRYEYAGVKTAKEVLEALRKQEYDILITGLMLKGMNGYELTAKVRGKYPSLPILILSAKGQLQDKLHAIDVGADDYLSKPFDPVELERRIRLNAGCRESGGKNDRR